MVYLRERDNIFMEIDLFSYRCIYEYICFVRLQMELFYLMENIITVLLTVVFSFFSCFLCFFFQIGRYSGP